MKQIPMKRNGMVHDVLECDIERFLNAGWEYVKGETSVADEKSAAEASQEKPKRGRRKKV